MLYKKLLALSLFAFCLPAFSQTAGAGGMSGTVTDPSGAVVPGVEVTIANTATGQTRTISHESVWYLFGDFFAARPI